MENLTNTKIKYSTPDQRSDDKKNQASSSSCSDDSLEDSHSISFSDLMIEAGESNKIQPEYNKPLQSSTPIASNTNGSISTEQVFASTDQITQYLQRSKGFDYDIVKDGEASLIVACRSHHSCPFHLKVAKTQGLWTFSGESSWPNHDHAATVASEAAAPFRSRLTGMNPTTIYSSSNVNSLKAPNSDLGQEVNHSSDQASSIEIILKKRVKEIKETFKRIDNRLKLQCADEVLALLRTRCKEHFNNSSTFDTLLVGGSGDSPAAGSPLNDSPSLGSGIEIHSNALDLPSFSITERKRKTVGTYKCRICRKEGHNSRSCDALQQSEKVPGLNCQMSPLVNSVAGTVQQQQQEQQESELIMVPEVLLMQQQSQRNKKMALQDSLSGMPAAGTLINQTLAIDEDMIREALLRPHEAGLRANQDL
jgi:hypothetical protein